MPQRRDVLRGLAAAIPALAISRTVQAKATKSVICQSCNGNGNCASNSCVNGLCAPYDKVCNPDNPDTKRPLYTCKAGRKGRVAPKCCKPGGRDCQGI